MFRKIARRILRRLGWDLHRLAAPYLTLRDLEFDLPYLLAQDSPCVIDVGANKGQTIDLVRRMEEGSKSVEDFSTVRQFKHRRRCPAFVL